MKKTVTPFTAQLVTYETSLPFEDVVARLDIELNKPGSLQFLANFRNVTTKEEIVDLVTKTTGENDFLYFLELNHNKWMDTYQETTNTPAVVYMIGNPLIAETIIRHDIRAGYMIPPRLMIVAKPGGEGTSVFYHLPSSLVAETDNTELRSAVKGLDDKLERMVGRITAE